MSLSEEDRRNSERFDFADQNTVPDTEGSSAEIRNDTPSECTADLQFRDGIDPHAGETLSKIASRLSRTHTHIEDYLIGHEKPVPVDIPDQKAYEVEFYGSSDIDNPRNWSFKKKLTTTLLMSFATLCPTWDSAVVGPCAPFIMEEFQVGSTVTSLLVALFVFGFAFGPVAWGPLSELYGRRWPMIMALFLHVCFVFACSTAENIQTLAICRFFAGACGSAPMVITASVFVDIYDTDIRSRASALFSFIVLAGPMVSPVASGFIAYSHLGWRWSLHVTGIMSAASILIMLLFVDETYGAVILSQKAQLLREKTNVWCLHARHDHMVLTIREVIVRYFGRPLRMLCTEPILLLLTIYNGYLYGLLYMCLTGVPLIFKKYGFEKGVLTLPYVSIVIGCFLSTVLAICYWEPLYMKDLRKRKVDRWPEGRLKNMMFSSILFPVGIFIMFWTGYYHEHTHWIVPCIGAVLYGMGTMGLFLPILNYILDTYPVVTASALAGNTFLRALIGGAFPLFSLQMFNKLGLQWGGTLVGCLAVLLLPCPFLFFFFGKRIRRSSQYSAETEDELIQNLAKK